jgi:CDP-diacylglycerol--serine O-phosphatidyltransferase
MSHHDASQARANAQAQLRRGMFLLPSLFTVGNIAAGYFSITQTMAAISGAGDAHTHLDWAAIAILFAIPFDSLDGRIARMTNTCSDFGKELHEDLLHAGAFICFLFLIGGVSRLARFNISHDAQPRNPGRPDRKYFVGMPIPAAAGLIAACVHFEYGIPVQAWWIALIWLAIVGISGFLMVSTWRFWSGKELSLSRRHPFQVLFLISIVLFVVLKYSQVVIFSLALIYMFSGIWARAAYSWSRRRRRQPAVGAASLPEPEATEPEPLDRS